MFSASRFVARSAARATRSFATATPKSSYKEKTMSDVWLSDTGAYPVMGVIIVGIIFPTAYGIWVMAKHPDARISKGSRKSTFRGELKGTPQE
ncbi:hypothetical protein B484DRAFT_444804 [Ochromonadaceae sp. CCMP2298]|nr:hypothetical protein B484DRAFT_444804 [Ochromonadaceae sp. CCMP2298]|mmetsp:Transcript_21500/g.47821  ORF Transcript_21500/g.47821 Transcript_21500/m.47821 type:complete len:93 (+) Transcript_21500:66-344(+)